MTNISKVGLAFAIIYAIACVYFIATQGLTGESFIALILGVPWSLILASFEYGNVSGTTLNVLLIAPLVLNTMLLYWIGSLFDRRSPMATPRI